MQRITLLCVGALKTPWLKQGCEGYIGRIRNAFSFDVAEIPASKQKDPSKQREEESQRLLKILEKNQGAIWVLDERGKGMDSSLFAESLGRARDDGRPMVFVLGGAYGFTDAVRARADRLLRLSEMTFPHELCRLVFLEQLYRASEILRGSGYHHA